MSTSKTLSFSTAFGIGVLFVALITPALSGEDDISTDDPPIDLAGAVQGSCPKGQLSTERGCVIPPRITKKVQPRFPKSARRAHVRGRVVLNASIEVDGSIGSIQVTDSTNPEQGFEEAATDAVKRWKYKPGLLEDEPVRVFFTVVIDFTVR